MKNVARAVVYALVVLGCYPQSASAQLATGDPASNFTLSDWITGVGNVTDLTFLSDGRVVLVVKQGTVIVADKDGNVVKMQAFNFTVDSTSEKGLLGVVRDDQDNLYFYASTGPNTDKHRVYKGRLAADGAVTVDLDKPVVTGGLEGPANHDGGGMVIYKGQLYIGVGDTGANRTPPQNKYGACLNKPNGKILRVNLDGSIPADNPLSSLSAVTGCAANVAGAYEMLPPDKRIYAWGLRNPWRLWIDPRTDLLWIGDVGETTQEEITVGGKGVNHGWPFNEGTVNYKARFMDMNLGGLNDCMQMTPATACTPPQDTYPHDDFMGDRAASVTGGLVPTAGCGWGAYESRYFFGDYQRGIIWTLDLKADRSGAVAGSRKVFGNVGFEDIVSFRMGPDGGMYIAATSLGAVKRIIPKNVPAACSAAAPMGTGGSGGSGTGGSGAGAGGSGGAGAGGSGGASAGGSGAAGAAGSGMAPGNGDSGGCSCTLSGRPAGGGVLLGVVFAAAAVLAWRRGRRRSRGRQSGR
jgi:glucose/arabinose dehydrogenase